MVEESAGKARILSIEEPLKSSKRVGCSLLECFLSLSTTSRTRFGHGVRFTLSPKV